MFNILINDLGTESNLLIKCADDKKLGGTVNDEKGKSTIQEELGNLEGLE